MKKVKTTCVKKSKGLESFHKIPLFAKQSITSTSSETYVTPQYQGPVSFTQTFN